MRNTYFKKNKYHATRSTYDGYNYHSKKEAAYAQELDLRKKAGDIKDWSRQEKIDLRVAGIHICNYYIDFVVTHHDGSKEYIEVKGFETDLWRIKWRLATALYPDRKFTLEK